MSLYEPDRHEKLIDTDWSAGKAQAAIDRIIADTHQSFSAAGLWKIHPFDVSPQRPPAMKPIYFGAAGVIWALKQLDEVGSAELGIDYLSTIRDLVARYRDDLQNHEGSREYLGQEFASYLIGEMGIELMQFAIAPSGELASQIHASVEAKIGDVRGLVWGGAGSMLAALFMFDRTRDPRWNDLYVRHFEALWDRWKYSDEIGCHLWQSDLYGISEMRLGTLHGFFANAFAMIKGRHLLSPVYSAIFCCSKLNNRNGPEWRQPVHPRRGSRQLHQGRQRTEP